MKFVAAEAKLVTLSDTVLSLNVHIKFKIPLNTLTIKTIHAITVIIFLTYFLFYCIKKEPYLIELLNSVFF